jgi:O-antigen/teichoic acid export membrane protein
MIEPRRVATSAVSSVLQIVVAGVTLAVLYRYLLDTIGVSQLGVWSLVLATSSLIQVANFGLTGSVVKHIAEYDAKGDQTSLAIAVETAVITTAFLSLIVMVCAYPVATYYLAFAIDGQVYQDGLDILPLALVAFFVLMVTSVYQSGLYGCQLIVQRNGILIAESLTHLILCMFLAPRYGLLGLASARVLQNCLTLMTSVAFLKSNRSTLSIIPYRWNKNQFKEMVGYATNFQIISLLVMLSDPITKALLSRFGGVSLVGYYEMANKLVQLFRSLIVSANQVLVPTFANLGQVQPWRVSELYLKSYRMVIYLALPGFGLLTVSTPLISAIWIGRVEPVFVWAMMLLCAGWFANTLAVPAYFASLGIGQMRINVLSHVIMTVANLLLAMFLGQAVGGLGVVAGWAIALTIGGVSLNILYCHRNSIAFGSLLSADDRILALHVVFGLGASYLAWQVFPRLWELSLPALGAPLAWGAIMTSVVTISSYLAILAFQMWKHSIRNDLQRWLIGALAKEPAVPACVD